MMSPDKEKYYIDPDRTPHFSPMEGVDSSVLTGLSGEKIMMVLTTIQAGYAVPEHSHPHEQTGMVQSGKARMKIGGKEHIVEKGDVCVFPSGIPHGAKCIGDKPFVMLDVFHPAREDFIEMVRKQGDKK